MYLSLFFLTKTFSEETNRGISLKQMTIMDRNNIKKRIILINPNFVHK